MIITLIGLALLIAGIVFAIIRKKVYFKKWKTEECIEILQFAFVVFGVGVTLFATTMILVNVSNYDVDYQNTLHQREMLEYRIDHMEDNITGNEMLYNDIVEFNNELRGVKKWANNPWTSWFYNEDIATIDYIEIDNN